MAGGTAPLGIIMVAGAGFIGFEALKHFQTSKSDGKSSTSGSGGSSGVPAHSTGAVGNDQTVSAEQLQQLVQQAVNQAGVPASWAQPFYQLVTEHEAAAGPNGTYYYAGPSSMNPQAVNGQHASGLAQLMPSTFAGYFPNGNIFDPLQNLTAGLKHIADAWNHGSNTGSFPIIPGFNTSGAYQGY